MDTLNNIQKQDKIREINEAKNRIWNAIRRFESEMNKDHGVDKRPKEKYQNKIKALKEELNSLDKQLAELKK